MSYILIRREQYYHCAERARCARLLWVARAGHLLLKEQVTKTMLLLGQPESVIDQARLRPLNKGQQQQLLLPMEELELWYLEIAWN